MTVQLNPEIEKYVTEKVSSGLYSSSLDVIAAGIHLLQEKEDTPSLRLQELRRELDRGIEQADRCELMDGEAFMSGLRQRHEERLQGVA